LAQAEEYVQELTGEKRDEYELHKYIAELEYEMELAARNLQFEDAARLRDKIQELKKGRFLSQSKTVPKKGHF
jgi:excinuclease ABC subunit B